MDGIDYTKAITFASAAFAIGIGSIGAALGQGLVGMKGCESIAKSPENGIQIRNAMLLAMALVETCVLYCLLIAGILIFKY